MKRKTLIILSAAAVIVIGVAAYLIIASSADKTDTFLYNPEKYDIVYGLDGDRAVFRSLAEKEEYTCYPNGLIVICEVAGPSINRILTPPRNEQKTTVVYAQNHVLTPMKINTIIYKGEDVDVSEGEIKTVIEPYYYVTTETPDDLKQYPMYTILSKSYEPMEIGKTYLVYMRNDIAKVFYYNGEQILCVNGIRDAVYCLDDTETHQGGEKTPYYDDLFKEALEMYGSYGSRSKDDN